MDVFLRCETLHIMEGASLTCLSPPGETAVWGPRAYVASRLAWEHPGMGGWQEPGCQRVCTEQVGGGLHLLQDLPHTGGGGVLSPGGEP